MNTWQNMNYGLIFWVELYQLIVPTHRFDVLDRLQWDEILKHILLIINFLNNRTWLFSVLPTPHQQ